MSEEVISFTGTRDGMSQWQKKSVRKQLAMIRPKLARHGDCVGADADFHDICLSLDIAIEIHPGKVDPNLRAFCQGARVVHDALPPLKRNQVMVTQSHRLIGTPGQQEEPKAQRAGGTWATIRFARKVGRTHTIHWPDGHTEDHWLGEE